MILSASYLVLFLSAFGAATLLPLQSEAVLVGLFIGGMHPVGTLLTVATVGNVLGSVVNWVGQNGVGHDFSDDVSQTPPDMG